MDADALVLREPRQLGIERFAVPELGDDDGILRVEACGLCGTDHEQYTGHIKAPGPFIPGHEIVGIVEALGSKAAARWGVAVGDRVAVEVFLSCRECPACLAGEYRRCVRHGVRHFYGFIPSAEAPGLWGGYATHLYLHPDAQLLPVPAALDPVTATVFNPLGAGIRWGVTVPDLQPGAVVAVLGPGIRGLSVAAAAKGGYTGIEIAPGTLHGDPPSLSPGARRDLRRVMQTEGVQYAGLHSLMPANPGLHLTTPDEAVRRRSWEFFRGLIDLSGDLSGGVMVLGSGRQRSAVAGSSPADARNRLRDGLAASADQARSRGVTLLLEPLSPQFTNVVNTLAEAIALVREIGHPAVSSMFDTHNTTAETEPHDEVIRKSIRYIRHVHLNEMDGRHPGTGNYDFARVLRALREVRYDGWVSVEVFQFKPSGEAIAREAMTLLRRIENESGGKSE